MQRSSDVNAKGTVIMTTVADEETAARLATRLIERREAACVQQVAIGSRYRWEGAVRCDPEILLLVKTSTAAAPAAMRTIEENHPYEVPEIVALPITNGLPAYLAWLDEETRAG
jgi:periplasmic divalent cation tolerance protein